jgi:cation transporter-like permease
VISRPSEAITGVVGSIVGAILVLLGQFTDVEVSTEASAAIIVLVSWIAAGVTWYIARKQRTGDLSASKDGTVQS